MRSGTARRTREVEAAGDPESVRQFKNAIATSNAVLIATPEYNGAVPGVLANAIDWASRPTGRSVLRNKPVAIMGAVLGKSGSANARRRLLGHLSVYAGQAQIEWCNQGAWPRLLFTGC